MEQKKPPPAPSPARLVLVLEGEHAGRLGWTQGGRYEPHSMFMGLGGVRGEFCLPLALCGTNERCDVNEQHVKVLRILDDVPPEHLAAYIAEFSDVRTFKNVWEQYEWPESETELQTFVECLQDAVQEAQKRLIEVAGERHEGSVELEALKKDLELTWHQAEDAHALAADLSALLYGEAQEGGEAE